MAKLVVPRHFFYPYGCWKHKYVFLASLCILIAVGTALATPLCRDLLSSFSSLKSDLPESAVIIALGHDTTAVPLQDFADNVENSLHRRVVTYRKFSDVHYVSFVGKWWEALPTPRVTAAVEQALRNAVTRCPNCRIIAFDLDGYEPKELFAPDGKEVWSYTNFEVDLLLRDRRLFLATRWYRNARELSAQEVEKFWAPTISTLDSIAQPLGYEP